MLDASASGLPLVVSNKVGAKERVVGNGRMYEENNVASMAESLLSLAAPALRHALGAVGRGKTEAGNNWKTYARRLEADYKDALK